MRPEDLVGKSVNIVLHLENETVRITGGEVTGYTLGDSPVLGLEVTRLPHREVDVESVRKPRIGDEV